jgi:hypothetical protein
MPRRAIGLGLAYATLCQMLAAGVAGAGHGWTAPFLWGACGFALFPYCFWSIFTRRKSRRYGRFVLALLLCLAADVAIVLATIHEGVEYLQKSKAIALLWIAPWLGGQLSLLWGLADRMRKGAGIAE